MQNVDQVIESSNENEDKSLKAVDANKSERRRRIDLRFSAQEMEQIEKIAKVTGLKAHALVRKALLKGGELQRAIISDEVGHQIVVAINRIGNNLNQLARYVNSEGRIGFNQSFEDFRRELSETRIMFLRARDNK